VQLPFFYWMPKRPGIFFFIIYVIWVFVATREYRGCDLGFSFLLLDYFAISLIQPDVTIVGHIFYTKFLVSQIIL
jgi:hypothetical protein